jgi:hypothetical protein
MRSIVIHTHQILPGNQVKEDEMCGACGIYEGEVHMGVLLEIPEGKRPLGKHKHRWEDIRLDLKGIGWEGMDFIHVAQGQVAGTLNTIINLGDA